MASVLCPLSTQTVFDAVGRPIVSALLFAFQAGTTTPVTIYSDPGLTTPAAQPVKTTGAGRVPPLYVGAGVFKFRLTDHLGAIIDEIDQIQGAVTTTVINNITQNTSQQPPGMIAPYYGLDAPDGWVRANGRTIGNATSNATEFADASTQALFVHLWNSDPNLAVSGSRGSSALGDFNAGKALSLPDSRRVGFVGIDGMGNGVKGDVTVYPWSTLGAVFGEETHLLTLPESPSHLHDATMDQQGSHIHGGTTDLQDQHTHNYAYATYNPDGDGGGGGPGRATLVTAQGTTDIHPAHGHNLEMIAAGLHGHTIVVADAGGDGAHNNVQPVMTLTILIKL